MDFSSLLCSIQTSIFFVSSNDCLLSFLLDTDPEPEEATTSVDPSASQDESYIKKSIQGN